MTDQNSRHQHFVQGALSNYVSLGEIPDFNEPGTQGFNQHEALLKEIKEKGIQNQVPLYRGARRSPQEESTDQARPGFLSFTTDKKVAEHFSNAVNGNVHVVAPGTIQGLPLSATQFNLPDQAEKHGFRQYPEENEWLVHRDSFKK